VNGGRLDVVDSTRSHEDKLPRRFVNE